MRVFASNTSAPRTSRSNSSGIRLRDYAFELPLVDPARLAEYVGRYESRPGSYWTVSLYRGELMIADSVVLPLTETEFYFQNWSRTFTFVRESKDAPWGIRSVGWDGNEETWPLIE